MRNVVIHLAQDRGLLTARQLEHIATLLRECGQMLGGWWKSVPA